MIQTVRIRLYDEQDHNKVTTTFSWLKCQFPSLEFDLLQNEVIDGDWLICIRDNYFESSILTQEAARFTTSVLEENGIIDRSIWRKASNDSVDSDCL